MKTLENFSLRLLFLAIANLFLVPTVCWLHLSPIFIILLGLTGGIISQIIARKLIDERNRITKREKLLKIQRFVKEFKKEFKEAKDEDT